MIAAFKGHADIVEALIANMRPQDLLLKNKDGKTALDIAKEKGQKEIIEMIVNHEPPLHRAILDKDITKLNQIIDQYDVNETSRMGDSALHVAASTGNTKALEILLQHGADYNIKNADGKTPLDVAKGKAKEMIDSHIARKKSRPVSLVLESEKNQHELKSIVSDLKESIKKRKLTHYFRRRGGS